MKITAKQSTSFVEFITKNQFKKESEGKLTQTEIEQVLSTAVYSNSITTMGTLPEHYENYDGLDYIPVMRFYFLSNDSRSYVKWTNNYGGRMIDERGADYQQSETATTKREVIRTDVTSVYGGSWVVDTDVVYDYGRKDIPRTRLVNTRLPIITFAPNMKAGRVTSLLMQMKEPLIMFNVAWNKVKDILAKGRMNVWELNLTAFENVALGAGGNNWSSQQAVDFLFQTNIAVTRQQTNQYGQTNGQAVREMASGLQLGDYFNTMSKCVQILDQLSASTVIEQGQLPDRLEFGGEVCVFGDYWCRFGFFRVYPFLFGDVVDFSFGGFHIFCLGLYVAKLRNNILCLYLRIYSFYFTPVSQTG